MSRAGGGASLPGSSGRGCTAGRGSCPRGAAGLGAPGRPVYGDRRGPGVPGSWGFCWVCFWGRNAIPWRPGLADAAGSERAVVNRGGLGRQGGGAERFSHAKHPSPLWGVPSGISNYMSSPLPPSSRGGCTGQEESIGLL